MNCYLDSSVILRRLFDEPHPLREWGSIRMGFSSRLLRLECLRTIDRLRVSQGLTQEETVDYLADLHSLFSHIGFLPLTPMVFDRAEQSYPTALGSLDSIHLATALLWRDKHGPDMVVATHDLRLAMAARSVGLSVIGTGG